MLARKALLQFISDNFVNFLGFISTFLIARLMGPVSLGTIGYSLSLLSILSMFSDLGYSQAHIKRVSEGKDIEGKLGTFLSVRIFFAFIFIFSTAGYLIITETIYKREDLFLFFSLFLYFLFTNFSATALTTFQGLKQTALSNLPQIFGRLSKTIMVIVVTSFSLGIIWLGLAYSLEGIVILFLSFFLLFRYIKNLKPNLKYLKSYTSFALPFAGIAVISHLIGNADKLLIKNFWSTKEVGLYFGIQSLIALPQSISNALMTLLFPKFSELQEKKDTKSIDLHLHDAIKYLIIVTLPIVLIAIFYSQEIPTIFFGKEFSESSSILIVSSLTVLLINLTRPYSNLLFAMEKGKSIFFISTINLVVLIISDLIFIPRELFNFKLLGLGGTGAALGIFNMWFINLVLILFLVKKYYKIKFYSFINKLILISLLCSLYLTLVKTTLPLGIIGMIIGMTSFGMVYLLLLFLSKLITRADLKYLFLVIHPTEMGKYIKGELKKS